MSNFRLYPVPQSQLSCVEKLLETARQESGPKMQKRMDVKYTLARVEDGYDSRRMAVYVDSLENPNHCLILAHWPGIMTKEDLVAVLLIYSSPEHRGNPEAVKTLLDTIESYAKISGADAVVGGAWLYDYDVNIESLWKSRGYVDQEKVFVKML